MTQCNSISITDTGLLELIRVSLGIQESLSQMPSEAQWRSLYALSAKQAVIGVCFVGISSLARPSEGYFAGMEKGLYYKWAGAAVGIQQRNERLDQQSAGLQNTLAEAGFRSTILKGQGVASLYDADLKGLRQSGDIDVFVDCGRKKAIEFAKTLQDEVDWDYKHLHLRVFPDTEVELHYCPQVVLNPWKNKHLQRWFKENEDDFFQDRSVCGITVPSPGMNLFYQLLHIYHHLFAEGIGLRQLMDLYYSLRHFRALEQDARWCMNAADMFGLRKFTAATMWVMKDVFGMPEKMLLCEPDEKEGRFILREVMRSGNFGNRITGGKMKRMASLLRYDFHLLRHYTSDTVAVPFYYLWHWAWKRSRI